MNTNYNLNLQTSAVPVVVNANQYDKSIRQYTFTIYNGDELADLTDVTAVTFDATKPDGYGLTYNGTISDGKVIITTTEQLTAVAGDVRATLRLWDADSDVIGSQRIIVKVERNGVDDDTIISDSDIPAIANAETYATTCQTLVNQIASESAQIQEIADNQCIIEDDAANNDVLITQYEQGSGSDAALVNTVNNNTSRIAALETYAIKSISKTVTTDANGVASLNMSTTTYTVIGWKFKYNSYKTTFANQTMELGTGSDGNWVLYTGVANTNIQVDVLYV